MHRGADGRHRPSMAVATMTEISDTFHGPRGGREAKLERTQHVQGVYSVLATPFRQGGDVDVESLRRYVEHFIGAGVTGFTALGVLGEAARLTERERALVLDTVLTQVNGRVPVVVGARPPRACTPASS